MWGKLMNAVCKSTASDTFVSVWQGVEFQHRRHMEECEVKEYLKPFQRESRDFLPSKKRKKKVSAGVKVLVITKEKYYKAKGET